ncbi:hypothetical protein EVAR_62543_1 [Eumeta japonica]|uniref:Uncharacterized protein n=1 Tax=Eumeta variegata TaxID=151549 RepID=A0A4C1YT74_EUMVA|nr:hypothetical protein EVAR_62543_1 [Eumeta japonica]
MILEAMDVWSTGLQHDNGPPRSMRYQEYRRKVTASAVAFRPVNESSEFRRPPPPIAPFLLHQIFYFYLRDRQRISGFYEFASVHGWW